MRGLRDYCIKPDTLPPTITPIPFGADMRRKNTIAFRIQGNGEGKRHPILMG